MDTLEQILEQTRRPENLSIAGYLRFLGAATVAAEMDGHITKQLTAQSSNDMDNAINRSSRLFELPAEIRERVWRDLLISPTGFIKPFRSGLAQDSLMKYDYHVFHPRTGRYRKPWPYASGEQVQLSILFSSRRIYHECASVFWGANTFILDPNDAFLAASLRGERGLAGSFCRKVKLVQLDIDIARAISTEPAESLTTALATIEKMADPTEGSLKSITFRPVASLLGLEMAIDTVALAPIYLHQFNKTFNIFEEINKRGGLERAEVKRTVAIDIHWHEQSRVEQLQFLKDYKTQADFLLDSLALYVGGKGGKLLVDGRLCFENLDGKVEKRSHPFPLMEATAEI